MSVPELLHYAWSCQLVCDRIKWESKCLLLFQLSWQLSVNIGWEGGVHVQTCGHHLHLGCLKSYLASLRGQQRHQNLAVDRYDLCPQCWFPELSILHCCLGKHFSFCSWVCMEHSPSLDAKIMSQEIPQYLWNPWVHYCLDKTPLVAFILKQIKPPIRLL